MNIKILIILLVHSGFILGMDTRRFKKEYEPSTLSTISETSYEIYAAGLNAHFNKKYHEATAFYIQAENENPRFRQLICLTKGILAFDTQNYKKVKFYLRQLPKAKTDLPLWIQKCYFVAKVYEKKGKPAKAKKYYREIRKAENRVVTSLDYESFALIIYLTYEALGLESVLQMACINGEKMSNSMKNDLNKRLKK